MAPKTHMSTIWHLKYKSATRGLTPHEREVEVEVGGRVFRVLAPKTAVNTRKRTLSVKLIRHGSGTNGGMLDLGGEVLNSSRRIKLSSDELRQVQQ
jgi:hypothetical protein